MDLQGIKKRSRTFEGEEAGRKDKTVEMCRMIMEMSYGTQFLIVVLLVAAAAAYFGIRFYQKANTKEAVAVVTVDGVEYGRYPLNEDRTERITLENGSYNVLAIKDGYADMTEASCPDQICVNHSKISRKNETIVCLPDKVVVTIENGEKEDIDLLTH